MLAAGHAQPLRPLVEEPVPLILKDGRIAQVSIYAVPFLTASSEMPPEVEQELKALIGRFANDCFLTAQVIGHVEPGADKDGGTLAAHRLARARAERIQSLMTEQGLPAKSIASVWDWQFATAESRATLWFFSLDPEESCEGGALAAAGSSGEGPAPKARRDEPRPSPAAREDAAAAQPADDGTVAENTLPSEKRPPEGEESRAAKAPAAGTPTENAPLTVVVRRPQTEAAPRPADPPEPAPAAEVADRPAAPAAAGEREKAAAEAPEKPVAAASTAVADPPGAPIQGKPQAPGTAAAATPAPKTDTPVPATVAKGGEAGTTPELEIVFDINSSWLPRGAARDLQHLLQRLGKGRYAVEIVTAVDNGPIRNGTAEDARRYNRWLAERRANRVVEWLRRRGDGIIAGIEQRFRENDPSRKVVIRARPLP